MALTPGQIRDQLIAHGTLLPGTYKIRLLNTNQKTRMNQWLAMYPDTVRRDAYQDYADGSRWQKFAVSVETPWTPKKWKLGYPDPAATNEQPPAAQPSIWSTIEHKAETAVKTAESEAKLLPLLIIVGLYFWSKKR